MNELLKVEVNENQEVCISGRILHEFLEVNSNYTTWFKRMCEYGFAEDTDFIPILEESTGGRPSEDHIIKLDMAKEISMLQRNEKGKQARQYFLAVEKEFNTPEKVMARAIKFAEKEISFLNIENKELKEQAEKDKPKVLFAQAVETAKTSILIGDLAKILKQNGVDTGQKRLFDWLRENSYLMKNGSSKNMPTQKSMDMKLFEVKETTINNPDGSIRINKTTKVTGKGQTYFINLFLGNDEAC